MIQLSLKRSGSPVIVHLNLPASSSAIAEASSQLDQASGAGKTEIVEIKSVIANLPSYLSGLDPDSRTQLAQLNRLSSIIAQMDSREQNIYAGALDGSSINNLNDVIRVAEQVSDYILIPNVNSDVTLGRYFAVAGQMKGDPRFPEAAWPYLDFAKIGAEYCHNSPTLDEEPLQQSILAAINSVMSQKSTLIRQITSAMEVELAPVPGESISLAAIEQRLDELNNLTRELVAEAARTKDAEAYTAQLREIMNEAAELKEKRAYIEEQRQNNTQAVQRIEDAAAAMEQASCHICEWDEALIRQLVDTVKVHSAEKITVYLRGGVQVDQDMI